MRFATILVQISSLLSSYTNMGTLIQFVERFAPFLEGGKSFDLLRSLGMTQELGGGKSRSYASGLLTVTRSEVEARSSLLRRSG